MSLHEPALSKLYMKLNAEICTVSVYLSMILLACIPGVHSLRSHCTQ